MDNLLFCQIASAGFYALLFFCDLLKKQLPTKRTVFFQLFLCAMMLDAIFSIDVILSQRYGETVMLNEAMLVVELLTQVACCVTLHLYIMAVAFKLGKNPVTMVIFGIIPVCILLTFVLLSPWLGIAYEFDQLGHMHRNIWYNVGQIILLLEFVIDLVVIWVSDIKYTARRRMLYSFMILIFILAIIFEISNSTLSALWQIGMIFFIYIFYLAQQSPDFYIDNTTGYFNRNGFLEVLYEEVQYQIPFSCLLVRVRDFTSMNQIYSAEILQKIQLEIGEIFTESSKGGIIYHIGSSTYAIMLRSRSNAEVLYYRLKDRISEIWNIDDVMVNHEYSYYELTYPEYGTDYEEIVQKIHYARSDHEAHHKAGELIHLQEGVGKDAERRQEIAHLIETAIMDNSIEIHFQPIFSFEEDSITSLEVLARLRDENRNYINPEYFIRIAEENHTIVQLGKQIFEKACIFAGKNHIFDMGIEEMSINLSPEQCRDEHLTEDLVEIASKHGIPMERIHLEITESEFEDKKAVEETLYRLKETGAKIALDDFGTGFSTLSNILSLPVDYVKIDKSLVWSFAEGKNQFLNDLMPMLKAEGKQIIAEGIENTEHIDIIKQLQGDYLQGYYYSKPLSEPEFLRFLKRFNHSEKSGAEA